MSRQERIEKLKRGVNSDKTPPHIKEQFQEKIDRLEAEILAEQEAENNPPPPPTPDPPPPPQPVKKKKAPKINLPHEKYLADNKIDLKSLPLHIRQKINGLKMFVGKDSDKVRAKAPEISNNIIEMIKKHLTPEPPPPPPAKEYTEEERQALLDKYKSRREKKKQLTESITS